MNRRRLAFLLYYVAAVAAIAVLMGRADWLACFRLANHGTVTQGTVTATACSRTSTVSYRFDVSGTSFTGNGSDGFGTPPCTSLKPGDPIPVTYLAAAPRTNLPGSPQERLADETVSIALVALFAPLVLLVMMFLFVRKKQG